MTLDPLNPYHLELAIIASTVLDPDVLRQPEIRALTPQHLRHLGGAWAIIREMDHAGRDIDLFSLAQQLHDPRWPAQLGVAQLTGLAAYSIRPQELASAAQGILNAHRRDLALSVAAGLQRNLTDAETDHGAAITQATADLNALRGLALQDASESVTDDLSAAMARIMNPRQHRGPTTGLPTLDAILGGWQPRTLNILAARPSMGKALTLDTNVLTPTGWRRMGDLALHDLVIGRDGLACHITGVWDQGIKPVYTVKTLDGASVKCCGEHLWLTQSREDQRQKRAGSVKSTLQIAGHLKRGTHWNYSLPFVKPVEFAPVTLPVDPYALGLYLGDGDSGFRFTNPEVDIVQRFRQIVEAGGDEFRTRGTMHHRICGVAKSGRSHFRQALDALNVSGCRSYEKFVPADFLLGSASDRLALLQGLCDTDGYVTDPSRRSVEFSTSSAQLRDHVIFLAQSLGGWASWSEHAGQYVKDGERITTRTQYRVILSLAPSGLIPVSSAKHLAKYRAAGRVSERTIVAVLPIGEAPCRCISVDGPDNLYVTEGCLVTHNSALLGQFAQAACYGDPSAPARVLMFSLEDGREITRMRTLARLSGVEIRHDETPGADAAQRLRNAAANMERHLRGGRWLIDEEARLDNIIQTAWRQHAQSPLGLVIVDQLSHVTTDAPRRQADNRTQLYGYITKTLKREVALRLGVPVILACQLSRESTKREKQRPELTDLRDSGEIEQDADTVTFIHRPEYYDAADAPGRAELLVKKNRNGPTKTAVVSCNMKLFKFWEGAP